MSLIKTFRDRLIFSTKYQSILWVRVNLEVDTVEPMKLRHDEGRAANEMLP